MSDFFRLVAAIFGDILPSHNIQKRNKCRKSCLNDVIYVCIHEWGGYAMQRTKEVHRIPSFNCGLESQIRRFKKYYGKYTVDLTITMSEPEKHNNLERVKSCCDNFISTDNIGMDFAGYSAFYNSIKGEQNAYVILTNSSVSDVEVEFIDDYINYMESNLDVGMLGVSYNSKCYQSIKRTNFTPHLQSFFLMSTIDVLHEIVKFNGEFPGAGIRNKRLLIREGEIRISQIVLSLGYKLAVVTNEGVVKFTNNRNDWNLKIGDCRIGSEFPNAIIAIPKV